MAVVRDGWVAGRVQSGAATGMPPFLSAQLTGISAALAVELPPPVVLRVAVAWTQLFGVVTFELFGQLAGALEPADEFFAASVEAMADLIGLARG